MISENNSLVREVEKLFSDNNKLDCIKKIDLFLDENGFEKGVKEVPKPKTRSEKGLYFFESEIELDEEFKRMWENREHLKVPNYNDGAECSNRYLYVGKSTSKGVISRINEHFKKGDEIESTYALKIGDDCFEKYKIKCHYYELKKPDEIYSTAYIAIFEQLLHEKLKPRVGSSR